MANYMGELMARHALSLGMFTPSSTEWRKRKPINPLIAEIDKELNALYESYREARTAALLKFAMEAKNKLPASMLAKAGTVRGLLLMVKS